MATKRREPFRSIRQHVATDSKFLRLTNFPAQKTGYRPEVGQALFHLWPETSIRAQPIPNLISAAQGIDIPVLFFLGQTSPIPLYQMTGDRRWQMLPPDFASLKKPLRRYHRTHPMLTRSTEAEYSDTLIPGFKCLVGKGEGSKKFLLRYLWQGRKRVYIHRSLSRC